TRRSSDLGGRARELDGEGRASARLALDPDRATVRLRDLAADVEAEAEPAVVMAGDGALEAIEDLRLPGRVDAEPVISNREPGGPGLFAEEDLDRPARAEFDRVGEQAGHEPREAGAIPAAEDRAIGADRDRAPGGDQVRPEPLDDLIDEGAE